MARVALRSPNVREISPRANAQSAEHPDVALRNKGEVVFVWDGAPSDSLGDDSGRGIYVRQFDPAGVAATLTDRLINVTTSDDQHWPAIASNGDLDFAFAWNGYSRAVFSDEIYGRLVEFPDIAPHPLLEITENSGTPMTPLLNCERYIHGVFGRLIGWSVCHFTTGGRDG